MDAAVVPIVLAGIFTKELSGAVAALVGFTGLFGGAAHYAAVLARRPDREVERATGLGFFFGGAVGIALLLADALT